MATRQRQQSRRAALWNFASSAVQSVVFFGLCAFEIVASLLLGGGTRAGFLSDAALQLFAIPLLATSLWRLNGLRWPDRSRMTKSAFVLCLAIFVLPLIQLVPLPPWIWTALPNRASTKEALDLLGHAPPWMPISLSPNATWLSLLSLIPPIALFLAIAQLGYRERRLLSLTVLAVGIIGVFVGLVQVAQGPSSALRFFEITNPTEAVGFFANRNHFAALIYCLLLLATAWAIDIAFNTGSLQDRKTLHTSSIALLTASSVGLVVFIAAETMARSRAGLGLTIAALCGAFALTFSDRRGTSGITPKKLLIVSTILAVIFAAQFALYRIMERFSVDLSDDARLPFARNTIEAGKAYMPFGSGLGTFVPIYAMFEKPEDVLANTYANHAHNDFLELWLETGVPGMALLGAFLIWFVLRSAQVWWRKQAEWSDLDRCLARAATMIVAFLLIHSSVDYPLRTGALMAIFAFSCALLVEPLERARSTARIVSEVPEERTLDTREAMPRPVVAVRHSSPGPSGIAPQPTKAPPEGQGRWGDDIYWPEQWRQPDANDRPRPRSERKPPKE